MGQVRALTVAPRPIATQANAQARNYIVGQLLRPRPVNTTPARPVAGMTVPRDILRFY